jgi:hypothetical protein
MSYPKCFDSQRQFDTWVELSENDGDVDPRISFCDSCSVRFQKLMIQQDRCENPTLEIDEQKEDIVDGEPWNQKLLISG